MILLMNKTIYIQQYIRRDCVEISGVPTLQDEYSKQIAIEIGQLMGVEI